MTALAPVPPVAADGTIARETVRRRSFKVPITLAVVAFLVGLMAFPAGRQGTSTFRLADRTSSFALPDVEVPTWPTVLVTFLILVALAGYAFWCAAGYRRIGLWVPVVFALVAIFGFLTWSAAGGLVPVTGLLFGALSLSIPLIFGALAGVIGERAGVVNVAIEAQFLFAAFASALVATATVPAFTALFGSAGAGGSATVMLAQLAGLVAAMIAGALVAAVLAAFSIRYLVDQVIVGVVLNVLIIGLTSFLNGAVMKTNEALFNDPPRFTRLEIPLLSEIPVLGPVLFNQTIIVYLAYILVPLVAWGLYRTRWGLRVRAVGEHPQAADTVGIKVNPTRFWNLLLAGGIAGIGGAYFTLGSVGQFDNEMTNGLGFIALAAVIFGGWDPIRATLAALLFGFSMNLETLLSNLGSPIPGEFMKMLPYVVTVLAVVGFAGKVRAPAADGKPYIKG